MKLIKLKKRTLLFFTGMFMLIFYGCKDEHPVPQTNSNFWLYNIETNPELTNLLTTGTPVFVSGGYKNNGIIIVRVFYDNSISDFIALDRTCPHETDSCIVNYNKNTAYFQCECCGSEFYSGDGYPVSGPSKFPLRQFKCDFIDGNIHVY